MRAITLHQPWATLIAERIKYFETRSWAPPANLWGERIAIHAASRKPVTSFAALDRFGYGIIKPFPRGAVVATAKLQWAYQVNFTEGDTAYLCKAGSLSPYREIPIDEYGDFSQGRYLWKLTEIEKLPEPIPARGFQGFWEWNNS